MPDLAATAAAARPLSPVSSTGRRPSCRSSAIAVRGGVLDRVRDDDHAAHLSVPRDPHGRAAVGFGVVRQRPPAPSGAASAHSLAPASDRRPASTARPSTTPETPVAAVVRRSPPPGRASTPVSLACAAIARPIGCSEASSRAPASAEHVGLGLAVGAGARRRTAIRPVVTVPVLSSTIVSTRRVDSRICGPLMRMPSWAPRPVPTSSAVGVARPERARAGDDQHRDRGGEGRGRRCPVEQPRREGQQREADDDGDEDRRDAVGEALHLGLAGLGVARRAGPSAPAGCRRRRGWRATTSRPPALTVAPTTASPGPTSTGTGSPVSIEASTADVPLT